MAAAPLVTKLSHFLPLSDQDVRVLNALCVNQENFAADTDIVVQGDVPRLAFVLTYGMACPYCLLPDGKRQILKFLIPGEVIGLQVFLFKTIDHFFAPVASTTLPHIPATRVCSD